MSPLTRLYLAFSSVSDPIWRAVHRRRLKRGKEDAARLLEKYGRAAGPRPEGEVLWFHALSVGESLALVPLIERALAERPGASVVLTTSTVTSIAALEKAGLADRVTHAMLPIDTGAAVGRFLRHWRPALAVFAELDFWPRLMIETHRRGVPMVLVNSRMSEASFRNRGRLGGIMRDVLGLFDRLLLQDEESVARFVALGAPRDRIEVVGALKAAARPLPADAGALDALRAAIGGRPVWLGAATHPVEEPEVVAAQEAVRSAFPDALLIVAPRYMDSANALEAAARKRFGRVARRSQGEVPDAETEVYIADTIGEMGLWYRLAPVSFIGHSLVAPDGRGGGGKNPYEAMALGSVVIHGPDVSDFSETYVALAEAGAAREVRSGDALAAAVVEMLDAEHRAPLKRAADRVIAERRGVLDVTWAALESMLDG